MYLDYYAALADGRNFKKELTGDGLVPERRRVRRNGPARRKGDRGGAQEMNRGKDFT